jgi:hypothetical protein
MKASEVIDRLIDLIQKHGDLEVALYADHEPAEHINYNPKSWVINEKPGGSPAFEFNGFEENE